MFTLKNIVLNFLKHITFLLLSKYLGSVDVKNLRVKILKIFEDSRMSSECGMCQIGVFLAPSYNFLKSMYLPVGAVKCLCLSCCVTMLGMFAQFSLIVGVGE